MSKVERYSSPYLQQVMADTDPQQREIASRRVAMAVRIADVLTAKGLSKLAFAGLMGKHPSEISKWLSGRHNFTLDTLSIIELKLGVSLVSAETTPALP